MSTYKIFISSPGDVARERHLAEQVIRRGAAQFQDRIEVEPYFWEYEPMESTRDYQENIPLTSIFDLVICILWKRLGSPLSAKHERPDEGRWRSGTEFELMTAVESKKARGAPDIFIFKNDTKPTFEADEEGDGAKTEIDLAQWKALKAFIKEWCEGVQDGQRVFTAALNRYQALDQFEQVLEKLLVGKLNERFPPASASPGDVCGITVPHHLLAVDLIARAFRVAAGGNYERIIVLFPDHFRQTTRAFATTAGSFQTGYGPVSTDTAAIAKLLSTNRRVEISDLFRTDHGIHAVLPFVARFFPMTKLIPIAIALTSQTANWDDFVQSLKPLVTAKTLIVQSTDFSHYLGHRQARERDQETLNAIATGKPEAILQLRQPAHLDSKGAQYIQMQLQRQVNGSVPEIIENKNSINYLPWDGKSTTSYIVQVYRKPQSTACQLPTYSGQQVWFLAGDTSFGRYMARPLQNEAIGTRLRQHILTITGGAPLILNLEGVTLERPLFKNLRVLQIAMEADQTICWLRALNVRAVILANNHTHDFGSARRAGMQQLLQQAGIEALMHGESRDFKAFRLVALSDLANHGEQRAHLISEADLEVLQKRRLAQPVLTFIHWGAEYLAHARSRELDLLVNLRRHGMPLVIGAHPHVGSTDVMPLAGGSGACVYSVGNFIFDQHDPRVSGTLVEVRFFGQGTYALRVHMVGNLYHDVINPF